MELSLSVASPQRSCEQVERMGSVVWMNVLKRWQEAKARKVLSLPLPLPLLLCHTVDQLVKFVWEYSFPMLDQEEGRGGLGERRSWEEHWHWHWQQWSVWVLFFDRMEMTMRQEEEEQEEQMKRSLIRREEEEEMMTATVTVTDSVRSDCGSAEWDDEVGAQEEQKVS
jgi:hypothetical protein